MKHAALLLLGLALLPHAVQADQTSVSVCVEALEQLQTLRTAAPVYKLAERCPDVELSDVWLVHWVGGRSSALLNVSPVAKRMHLGQFVAGGGKGRGGDYIASSSIIGGQPILGESHELA
jgi:hypothetical protein